MGKIDSIRAFNRFYTNQIGLLDRIVLNGLSLTEARVFFEIGSRNGPSARELVGHLGFDEGYLSRVIKSLEKRDLIDRTPSRSDRRVYQLGLTKDGSKAYARLVETAENAVHDMISHLPDEATGQLLEAMATVEGILSWPNVTQPKIRDLESGDIGWVIKRHGELYAANEGFDMSFEALVAKIMSDFIENQQKATDRGWIIESGGLRTGCVFVVAEDDSTARLRLLLVEPFARGKGVGQTLMETAIDHARAKGFSKMVLWTQKNFESACRLYARNGFELKDSRPGKRFGREVVDQSWELCL